MVLYPCVALPLCRLRPCEQMKAQQGQSRGSKSLSNKVLCNGGAEQQGGRATQVGPRWMFEHCSSTKVERNSNRATLATSADLPLSNEPCAIRASGGSSKEQSPEDFQLPGGDQSWCPTGKYSLLQTDLYAAVELFLAPEHFLGYFSLTV